MGNWSGRYPAPCWVVMGVSGCGKSTVGQALAAALNVGFIEGDDLHSSANVKKMSLGLALTDDDRRDWLRALRRHIAAAHQQGSGLVLSCSSLKRRYRDVLRGGDPGLRFAHLDGPPALIAERMAARTEHYMPPSLLASQLRDLEPLQPDEAGIVLDLAADPAVLVARIVAAGCPTLCRVRNDLDGP